MSILKKIKNIFNIPENKPIMVTVNSYRLNIQSDISAYELFNLTHIRTFSSYKERDDWYNSLSDLCKRHVIKYQEDVDYKHL